MSVGIRNTLAFFRSVILSGEEYSSQCELDFSEAIKELEKLEAENAALKEEKDLLQIEFDEILDQAHEQQKEVGELKEENERLKYAADLANTCREEWKNTALKYNAEISALKARAADCEEVLADKRRLTRELDVLLNGDSAAKQASLCDIVSQLGKYSGTPLLARVAELEEQRFDLAEAAYKSIIAFNNWQDESLDAADRMQAILNHTDCIRNLWNLVAIQHNERAKEPANEG